jgi:hypothetical protein
MPKNKPAKFSFSCLYNLPGEGLVAEFRLGADTLLFDKRGLQARIVERRRRGEDTRVEEEALARMNALGGVHEGDSGLALF